MEKNSNEAVIAKLNEVTDLLGILSSANLKQFINPSINSLINAKGCDSNCDCRGGYCGCNSSVTANERFSIISYPEYQQLRDSRLEELKKEINKLEGSNYKSK